MTSEDTHKTLIELIHVNFEIDPSVLTPDAHLRADLGLDSLDLVDLTFFVKHAFGIDDGVEAYKDIQTVGQLAAFVDAKRSEDT